MKKLSLSILSLLVIAVVAMAPIADKYVSTKTHIKFFSTTPVEDIEANNYASVSTLDTSTGDVVFSVPMQSFEFEKALMQEHYNGKDFLNTKKYPKAKLTGKVTNLSEIDFNKDGTYQATVSGEMTIKEVSKQIDETGTITVAGGKITVNTKFNLTLSDYGIEFKKGKPSSNIAKTIEVTAIAEYSKQ
jgi:polyisoprenoid-binding protein YceI